MNKDSATAVMIGALILAALITAGFGLIVVLLTSESPPVERSAGDFELKIEPDQENAKLFITHMRGDKFQVFKDGTNPQQFLAFRVLVNGEEWPIDNSGLPGTFMLHKAQLGYGFDDFFAPGDTLEAIYGDKKPEIVTFIEKKPDGSEYVLWGVGKEEITIHVDFYAQPRVACIGEPIRFNDASTNNPKTWIWDFGDGTTSNDQNPTHTYNNVGQYTVTLTAGDPALTEVKTNYISIQPIVPDFSGSPVFGIEPLNVNFTELSRCGQGESFSWNFGDGNTSTIQHPMKDSYYAENEKVTRYTVTLLVTQSGIQYPPVTKINYITVCPKIVANFEVSSDGGPAPLKVIFTDTTKGDPNRWQWNFGDGTKSNLQHPEHTYTQAGDYTVALTAYNLCGSSTKTYTITVPLSPSGHIIRASADTGGSISPSGNVMVADGSDQQFTLTPDNECYYNNDIWVDGTSIGPQSSYTFNTVDRDHTIHANFTRNTYTITHVRYPEIGGTISPVSPVHVLCGDNQAIQVTANPCYTISDINIDGTSKGPQLSPYTVPFTNVRENHNVQVWFSNQLSISASAGSGGTISPSGIVPVTCGKDQSFTITANPCYNISNIIIDGVSKGPTGTTTNITTFKNVITNHAIRAEFQHIKYPITASAGSGGNITPVGISQVACGSSQSYNITANPCYKISNVVVDGVSLGTQASPYSYTFPSVQAAHTISATFQHLGPFTISSSAVYLGEGYVYYPAPSGTINAVPVCSNPCTVVCGNSQGYSMVNSFTIGVVTYVLSGLTIDGIHTGPINPYTFTNVQKDHTIIAEYVPTCYFADGYVRNMNTGVGISGVRIEIWDRQRKQLLWYSVTKSDGSYVIPVMLKSGEKYDINIGNNSPPWIVIESHLYYEGQDAGLEYGVWRDDIVFNPGGKCKTTLDWRGTR